MKEVESVQSGNTKEKYDDKVRQIRKISKDFILKLLEKKSRSGNDICSKVKEKFSEYCNDDIKCRCRENTSKRPEWEHQVKWAILDLKYRGMLTFEKESKVYAIKKNNIS